MRLHQIFMVILVVLSSCTPKTGDAAVIEHWHEEIMEIHDAVMPELSTIHRLKKRIRKIDVISLKNQKETLIEHLDAADESMMSWMAGYKKPKNLDSLSLRYLIDQKIAVQGVDSVMMSTIAIADNFLTKYEN